MNLKFLLYCVITCVFVSCKSETKEVNNLNFQTIGSRLLLGDVSKINIDQIDLESSDGKKYCLVLDSLGRISEIQNLIKLPHEKEYVNTWIGLDKQGQISFEESYYYQTFMTVDDTMIYLNCSLERVLFDDSKSSILVSDFKNEFITNSKIDTIPLNNGFGIIPIKNWKIGNNNIKLILLEEGLLNGKPTYKKTYIDKDIFIKNPD